MFSLGSLFPEFMEAAQRMHDEMSLQLLPDGGQYELTPGYHKVSMTYLSELVEVAKMAGTQTDVPNAYADGLKKGYHWLINLATPSGGAPYFNDSWKVDVGATSKKGNELFPEDPFIAWAANDRLHGTAPEYTSVQLKESGYSVLRSGWESDAHYAVLDVGPLGYGHYHQDKLNMVLYPYGRQLLFDNGGGNYEFSPYRTYGVSTQSHNTVLVDGLPQRRPTRGERDTDDPLGAGDPRTPVSIFHAEDEFDYVSGVYQDGYGELDNKPVQHRREVLFIKPSMFLVVDTLTPNDTDVHHYQARWHLLTTNWGNNEAIKATVTTDNNAANLAIIPLETKGLSIDTKSGVTEPELLGWELEHGQGRKEALTVLHNLNGTGVHRFVTLLLPLAKGEDSPVTEVSTTQQGMGYEVLFNNGSKVSMVLAQETVGGMTVILEDSLGNIQRIDVEPGNWGDPQKLLPPKGLRVK